jgi:MviN-like protein.
MSLCGVAANGVFAVAYKIPSILNAFQSIFNQAWVLSSVKEYDPKDTDGFFARTYNLYNAILVLVCAFIIAFNKVIAKYLFLGDFYIAWKYVPYLTIAIIFGALSGYIGGIFSAAKDTKIFSVSTLIGAFINLVLTYLLVKQFDAIGAALATGVSYYLVWLIRICCVRRYMKLKLKLLRDHISYICLLCLSVTVHFLNDIYLKNGIISLFLMLVLYLFKMELTLIVFKIKSVIKTINFQL